MLLVDGRVLIVGGGYGNAELFNPATNTWSDAGGGSDPTGERPVVTATLLADGRVLVTFADGPSASTAQIFNPMAGS